MKKKLPSILFFLLAAFYISLLPVINLTINRSDTQGERFIYLPSAFFIMCVVSLFYYFFINRRAFVTTSIVLVLFFRLLLYQVNKNWIIASEITQNILNTIKQVDRSNRLLIISLPDNINGAYIFRNGLQNAIRLFVGPKGFKSITVISLFGIFSESDGIEITRGSSGYSFTLTNSKGCFRSAHSRYGSDIKCKSFSLNLEKLNIADKIIFYSAGKMETLKL